MNLQDFVDSIQPQFSDLENVANEGFVNGITKLILRHLTTIDETKRAIHCTDIKREILYVKDNNIWEKDDDFKKTRKAINKIAQWLGFGGFPDFLNSVICCNLFCYLLC
jgi:hypothetical protein